MAKFVWGIFSGRAIVDQETNTVSYIDVIENVVADKFPAILQRGVLSLTWHTEEQGEELVFHIYLDWPGISENKLIEPGVQVMKSISHRFNLVLNGIKIEKPGELSFTVKQLVNSKWKTVFKLTCPILQTKEEETTN